MRTVNYVALAIIFSFVSFLFTACFSGGGGGSSSGGSGTGQVSFAITDAPVSNAQNVVVMFDCLELQHSSSGRIMFTFDPVRQIDLLQLQGNEFAQLISNEIVPSGQYQWARLCVLAEQGILDSYIVLNNAAQFSLYVPSGDQSGLKVNTPFYVAQDTSSSFTIDFDLQKSVNDPQGFPDYRLRPTLRLVKNDQVGSITGTVDPALIMAANCANTGGQDEAVYVYAGSNVTPDDTDGNAPDPITTAFVKFDPADSMYKYTASFLVQGNYTVAFTCQFSSDNSVDDDPIVFVMPTNATVVAGQSTTVNFAP